MSDGVIHLRARDAGEYEEVLLLVSALMAMEVDPVDSELGRVMVPEHAGARKYDFYFRAVCGRGIYQTADLIDWWKEGEDFVKRERDHPFAYVMAALLNWKVAREYVDERAPLVFLRKGKQVGMLPLNASARQEEEILGSFR